MRFAVVIPARSAVSHIYGGVSLIHDDEEKRNNRFAVPPIGIPCDLSLVIMKLESRVGIPKVLASPVRRPTRYDGYPAKLTFATIPCDSAYKPVINAQWFLKYVREQGVRQYHRTYGKVRV
jgi:hypothetical protein